MSRASVCRPSLSGALKENVKHLHGCSGGTQCLGHANMTPTRFEVNRDAGCLWHPSRPSRPKTNCNGTAAAACTPHRNRSNSHHDLPLGGFVGRVQATSCSFVPDGPSGSSPFLSPTEQWSELTYSSRSTERTRPTRSPFLSVRSSRASSLERTTTGVRYSNWPLTRWAAVTWTSLGSSPKPS